MNEAHEIEIRSIDSKWSGPYEKGKYKNFYAYATIAGRSGGDVEVKLNVGSQRIADELKPGRYKATKLNFTDRDKGCAVFSIKASDNPSLQKQDGYDGGGGGGGGRGGKWVPPNERAITARTAYMQAVALGTAQEETDWEHIEELTKTGFALMCELGGIDTGEQKDGRASQQPSYGQAGEGGGQSEDDEDDLPF